jgi:hypothetical protein
VWQEGAGVVTCRVTIEAGNGIIDEEAGDSSEECVAAAERDFKR